MPKDKARLKLIDAPVDAETRIRDGRLVDETCLGFSCGAVEALITEIRLWRAAGK